MAKVIVPSVLMALTYQKKELMISGRSLKDILTNLIIGYPQIKPYLLEEDGKQLCSYVSIYLNQQDIRQLQWSHTEVTDHDIIMILPAMAGG